MMPGVVWDLVLNQLIRTYGDRLPASHIVYSAAAATIRDTEDSICPYLRLRNGETHFHNFMLHKQAEAGEINAWDLSLWDSLLMWIDSFLASRST